MWNILFMRFSGITAHNSDQTASVLFSHHHLDTSLNIHMTWAAFRRTMIANVLPRIHLPNDERQQEQGSRVKHSRVSCTSERNPGSDFKSMVRNLAIHWMFVFLFGSLRAKMRPRTYVKNTSPNWYEHGCTLMGVCRFYHVIVVHNPQIARLLEKPWTLVTVYLRELNPFVPSVP